MGIQIVTVVGGGTMGNGIAHVCALSGRDVRITDVSQDLLDGALATISENLDRQVKKEIIDEAGRGEALERIRPMTDLDAAIAGSQLIIEAVPEKAEIKYDLFRRLDAIASAEAILASNTSSISITAIGAATARPDRVIGMHFMNPVPVMSLVEVIRGLATSDATTAAVMDFSTDLGKTPVEVNDFPGFVSNRILGPMINEAVFVLMEGCGRPGGDRSGYEARYEPPHGTAGVGRSDRTGHLPQHHGGLTSGVGGRPISTLSAPSKIRRRGLAGT